MEHNHLMEDFKWDSSFSRRNAFDVEGAQQQFEKLLKVESEKDFRNVANSKEDIVDWYEREEDELYGQALAGSHYSKTRRPWEYAIQLKNFSYDADEDIDDKTKAKKKELHELATRLEEGLVLSFGDGNVDVNPEGVLDKNSGFIKVTAEGQTLMKLAELEKLQLEVAPWRGRGYREYTRLGQKRGEFLHPWCSCLLEEDCHCCASLNAVGYCNDVVLLPYQRQCTYV